MPKVLGVKEGSIDGKDFLEQSGKTTVIKAEFKLVYYVLGDSLDDDIDDILATSGIPNLYSSLQGCFCKSRNPKEINTVRHPGTGAVCGLWEVACDFDTDTNPEDDERPEAKTPKISWSGETDEEVLEQDAIDGFPITTLAGEPILITSPYVCPVLQIERYELWPFDPDVILDYSHRTNSTTFWGAPTGSALMLPMNMVEEMIKPSKDEPPEKYAKVTYNIKFKIKPNVVEPWKARVLHHGFKYIPTGGGSAVIYRDRNGNPATVNLTAGGFKLPDGNPPEYLEFNRFQKADFNALTLGPY